MSFLSGLVNDVKGFFGGNNNAPQKKKNQPQQNSASTVLTPQRTNSGYNPAQNLATPEQLQQNLGPSVNLTSLNPNALQKVGSNPFAPSPAPTAPAAAPQPHASLWHDITHNPVTNIAGSIVKPTIELAHAAEQVPHAIYREVQNKPIDDIQRNVFGTNDSGTIAKKIIGDTVSTGLNIVAPGVDSLAATGAKVATGDAAAQLARVAALHAAGVTGQDAVKLAVTDAGKTALTKIVPKAVAGAAVGGTGGATSAFGENGNVGQIIKGGLEGAAVGGLTGGLIPAASSLTKVVAPKIGNAIAAHDAGIAEPGIPAVHPNEVSPGIGSKNPAASRPVVEQAQATPKVPVAPPVTPEVAGPNGEVIPQVSAEHPKAVAPQVVDPNLPPVEPAPPKGATTAPNAPGVRKSLETTLNKAGAQNLKSVQTEHEVLSNKDLNDAAQQYTGSLTDDELVNAYKEGATFNNAGDIAKGVAATKRLGELSAKGDENASAAIDHILNGAERAGSEGGRTLNYVQSFYDSLPAPAKTSYIIRQMDKIREANGEPLLRDDVALASEVKGRLDSFLAKDENFKQAIADAENEAMNTANGIKAGDVKGNADLTNRGVALQGVVDSAKRDQSKNTSELARYYDSQAKQKVGLDQKAGNLGRSLMLSSPTGRANDVITTGLNSAHHLITDVGAATLGKVANAVTGKPGKFASTLPSPAALVRGVISGAKDSRARFKGDLTGSDASSLIKAGPKEGGKGGIANNLGGLTGLVTRPVRAATEIATDLSNGVKQAKIQQMASNEGKKLNLTGDDLKAYTSNRTAAPSREFIEAGNKVQQTVNNMQDNPITNTLQRISNAATDSSADTHPAVKTAGQLLKNLTLPFTRWTGGQLWNGLVDNNAAVNAGKMLNALRKGDQQEAINQASRLGVNGVGAASVGYALAKSGILVHKDAQGYNDDGTYLKVDGRYIPAGFLGFFAPGMILGQSTHDVLNGTDKHQNPAQKIADITGDTLVNTLKAGGASSLTGEKNQIIQAIQRKQSGGEVGATALASVAGQYIPAGNRDVNAILDNGLQVGGKGIPSYNNPNHEAALTKVTDPNSKSGTAKAVIPTLENQLLNKIPGVSQHLPRNPGVAAPDLVDRTTRGNRDTATTVQNRADAKVTAATQQTLEQRIASNTKSGVPDPQADSSADKKLHYAKGDSFDNAIENRIENKKYDQAVAGLQFKLDDLKKSPDATTKQTDPVQKQLSVAKVLKAGNYDPTVRDLYSKTSVSEWRNMGDSSSDTYDQKTYDLLYNYDKDLAGAKASGNTNSESDPKYSAKTLTAKQRGAAGNKAATAAANLIKSNTIGNTPSLAKFSYGSLAPEKITEASAKIPTIQSIPSNQLIKKRAISVTAG